MKQYMQKNKKPRDLVNEYIPQGKIRLVDENGENVGIVERDFALNKAYEAGLDLVCVAPNANPKVARIMDYSKYRFDQQKKLKEFRKNQKVVQIKEVQLSYNIGEHDFNFKLRNARRFIENGDKVKITMRFRGRMMQYKDAGKEVIYKFAQELSDIAKVNTKLKDEGRNILMILEPINNK